MIRKANKPDIIQIAEICHQLHKTHFRIRPEYFKIPDKDILIQDLEYCMDNGFEIVVFEENNEIKGYATFYIDERENNENTAYTKQCVIKQLAVSEEYSSMGIDFELLEFIKEIAIKHCCNSLELSVLYENYDAVDFYASAGFTPKTYEMELNLR